MGEILVPGDVVVGRARLGCAADRDCEHSQGRAGEERRADDAPAPPLDIRRRLSRRRHQPLRDRGARRTARHRKRDCEPAQPARRRRGQAAVLTHPDREERRGRQHDDRPGK